MAENKKSFLLYADLIHTFNELTDDEAGKLIKHVLAYVNDLNPQTNDKLIKIAFEPIRQQLKRDLKHWEEIKEKRSKAGMASVEARKQSATKSTHVNTIKQAPANSTVNDNVTVTVNDNVTVNVKESNARAGNLENSNLFRQPKIPSFEDVHRVFLQNGGTEAMARAFFDTNTATEWFFKGSPITNFSTMVPNYIRNWKQNEKPKRTNDDWTSIGRADREYIPI